MTSTLVEYYIGVQLLHHYDEVFHKYFTLSTASKNHFLTFEKGFTSSPYSFVLKFFLKILYPTCLLHGMLQLGYS